MSKYIRLSHILSEKTPSYGNRDHVIIRDNSSIKKGDTANTSCWILSNNHIGTHIDTPNHFSEQGTKSYNIPINDFFFDKVQLVDIPCTGARLITSADFKGISKSVQSAEIELLFIRTGYEQYRQTEKYWNDNPGLAPDLADYFRLHFPKLRCIGFDFISLTSWKYRGEGRKSHKTFLCPENGGKEILVIEDMTLAKVVSPIQSVIVAPLFVEDGNGGPVTVFAEI